jgi:hypothetical protein
LRTTSRPTPRPESSLTDAAVVRPGSKISRCTSAASSAEASGPDQPALAGLLHDALGVEPRAVVLDHDRDAARLARRGDHDAARLGLAGRAPLVRRLDPVRDRVAHQVRERVHDVLGHLRIDLDVLAAQHQPRRLAGGLRRVAQHARGARQRRAERNHAHADHQPLQLRVQPLGFVVHLARAPQVVRQRQPKPAVRDRDLSGDVEQAVERGEVDPQRARAQRRDRERLRRAWRLGVGGGRPAGASSTWRRPLQHRLMARLERSRLVGARHQLAQRIRRFEEQRHPVRPPPAACACAARPARPRARASARSAAEGAARRRCP